eukprot:4055790-Pyramimonas_sp.AAC.1
MRPTYYNRKKKVQPKFFKFQTSTTAWDGENVGTVPQPGLARGAVHAWRPPPRGDSSAKRSACWGSAG